MRPLPSITRRLVLARMALIWERLWGGLWPAATIAGLFLALALSDLLPRLHGWVHAAVLVLFGAALLAALAAAARSFRWPGVAEAARRLESPAEHRPLTASRDGLAQEATDPVSLALWQAHARRASAQVKGLRAVVPHPGVPARDPHGLRAIAVLALFVAGVAAWPDPWPRLGRAVSPALQGQGGASLSVDLWVTPPDYTRLAPFYRAGLTASPTEGGAAAVEIEAPQGSRLLLLIHGAESPTVRVGGAAETPEALADASHRLEATLQPTAAGKHTLAVLDGGRTLAEWPLKVIADRAPEVAFAAPPGEGPRWRLRLPFTVTDDHGVAALKAVMSRDGANEDLELAVPPGQPATARGQPMVDLTAHPWAGQAVSLQLVASDAAGQVGRSDVVPVTLPERSFDHPVAQELAGQRKTLLAGAERHESVAAMLDAIAAAPGRFDGDVVAFLGLRVASARLRHAASGSGDIASVADILWKTALRIEEGDRSAAEERLAEAEKALEKALEEGAGPQEIQRLSENLRQALAEFMRAMMDSMSDMALDQMPDITLPQDMIDPADMMRMLEQLGDMSEIGAQDAAREVMRQLRQMLQALRNAQPMPSQAAREMRAVMDALRELASRQEGLLNETFRNSRETPQASGAPLRPGRPPPPTALPDAQADPTAGADLAERQEALRRDLGDIMGRIGEQAGQVPENLGQAELDMRQASEALAGQSWAPAEEAQGRALEALRKGAGEAMQQMMQAMGGGQGMMMPFGPQPGMGTDPLGRGLGGMRTEGTEIPTKPDARRARDILLELRRRSNDLERPGEERDYLRRLLRQF